LFHTPLLPREEYSDARRYLAEPPRANQPPINYASLSGTAYRYRRNGVRHKGSEVSQPLIVPAVRALDDREERLLDPARDRAGLAAADPTVIDVADRRDLRRGAGQEHLVGDVQLVARDQLLADLDAVLAEQL